MQERDFMAQDTIICAAGAHHPSIIVRVCRDGDKNKCRFHH